MIYISIQGQEGSPPPTSVVSDYGPLLSDLLTQIFEPPLQPSNVPDPLPQLSASPLQSLAVNPPPPLSVLLQERDGPFLLTSTAHAHTPLLLDFCLRKCVPICQLSDDPAPLAQISALPLQRGRPPLQSSAVNPPPLPHLSALPLQQDVPTLQPLAVHAPPHLI